MDWHGRASGVVGRGNPFQPATMKISTGYATAGDGSRTPTTRTVTGSAQVQALTFMDLKQLEGVNMNGERRVIYFYGDFNGVVRPQKKGGDLVVLEGRHNTGSWLIAQVLEQWPTWCKVAVTLQMDQNPQIGGQP